MSSELCGSEAWSVCKTITYQIWVLLLDNSGFQVHLLWDVQVLLPSPDILHPCRRAGITVKLMFLSTFYMIYNDMQWYATICNDMQSYVMIYNDIQWYTTIYNDIQWDAMMPSDEYKTQASAWLAVLCVVWIFSYILEVSNVTFTITTITILTTNGGPPSPSSPSVSTCCCDLGLSDNIPAQRTRRRKVRIQNKRFLSTKTLSLSSAQIKHSFISK